ncbi:sensor histidine kinase [Actinoallomurus sp. CA-150999]|uniref:sensor histidine kinase n=1 Tax=Actinoallomurus sp. CA-150999 TaxID=3239887 RepID=UPI003D926D21
MRSPKRSGRWSLRTRLLVMVLVPLVCLAGLWAFAAFLTSRDALNKYEASTAYNKVALPGAALSAMLQRERVASAVLLSTHGRQGRDEVNEGRAAADAAQAALRKSVLSESARRSISPTTEQRLSDLWTQLDGLSGLRGQVDSGSLDSLRMIGDYNTLIESVIRVFSTMIVINDSEIYQQGTALVSSTMARELVMREDAIVTSALVGRHKLTAPAYAMFTQSAYNERYLFDAARAELKPSLRTPWDEVADSEAFTTFRALEQAIIDSHGGRLPAQTAAGWQPTVTPLMTSWAKATIDAGTALTNEAKPIGDRIVLLLYLAAGIGLFAMAISILVSVLFGRALTREMSGLQRAALNLAEERMPKVIKRLRAGEEVDVAAESPPVEAGSSKEGSRVADALTTLQRTAVEAAVGEARLRKGINQVFLNLAWRNQSLLHRQLAMLDTMEKQARDPDVLDDLFALDHLTTRMRRHAEGLAILSGAAPARGWHNPVGIRDILRAAVAEVEDYTRVDVEAATPAALDGAIVADVTHLLAELLENATAFSPPTTQVQVRGELVAHGYAVEIEDRGIGLNDEELAEANGRLSNPPEFDLLDSDRLGLFIIGRLAERHGIRVTLGRSPYGGVRAVVLIPPELVAGDDDGDYEQTWADESPIDAAWHSVVQVEPPVEPPPSLTAPLELAAPAIDHWADGPVWSGGGAWGAPDFAAPGWAGEDIQTPHEGWTDDDAPELPKRVRQTNLAPQLRDESTWSAPPAGGAATTRPPEETRSLMSSLQQGWQRGREAPDLDE